MFKTLQGGRGIAALLVVLYHLNGSVFGKPKYWDHPAWSGLGMGHAGVNFFFVLSGFIIAWVHKSDVGIVSLLPSFARKRVIRIYPAYWVFLAAILPMYFVSPSLGTGYERYPGTILTSLLLIPTGNPPILSVAWTLCHEMLFYLIFSFLFAGRRLGIFILTGWFACCAAHLIAPTNIFPLTFILAPINLLFALGMISAKLIEKNKIRFAAILLAIGVCSFFGTGWMEVSGALKGHVLTILYGIASALVVVGAVQMEREGRLTVPTSLVHLGNSSYSLYLVHFPVLSLLAKVYFFVGGGSWSPTIGFFVLLLATIASGFAYHEMIERPLLRLLARRTHASRKPIAAA